MTQPHHQDIEIAFQKRAIEEARLSVPEDGLVHPKVGAVVVLDGEIIASAHRGELAPGDHAEFTALERKLPDDSIAGSTVYTTLEPCTTRSHPKVPCAKRLAERRVARVVIGMLDPDGRISGKGVKELQSAGVAVEHFANELAEEVVELNRDYRRLKESPDTSAVDHDFVATVGARSLDEWYRVINTIFWLKNAERDPSALFAHLVEVIGGISPLASTKAAIDPQRHLAKAVAWWLALCGSVSVESVESLLWDKFPTVCPYCHLSPHDPNVCLEMKASHEGPRWEDLDAIGRLGSRPTRLGEWQVMFATIYPVQQTEGYGLTFARLAEELGELAEAVRVFRRAPGYILSEAADVFAWLMRIQNLIDIDGGVLFRDRGSALETAFASLYPDACRDCARRVCECPDVLPSTIGRIGHEDPLGRGPGGGGRFMSPDERRRRFSPGA